MHRTSVVVIGVVVAVLVVFTVLAAMSGAPVSTSGLQGLVTALA